MHLSPEGRSVLDNALVDRFEVVADDQYDGVRRMLHAARENEFTEIR